MRLIDRIVLPKPISAFERRYLENVNRVALVFFALHVPVLVLVAWANGTRPGLAALLSLVTLAGPAAGYWLLPNPRHVSVVHGIAAMFFGALLVHFGQGPVQIEMHFYFFALIAMLAVFANPLVICAAALTVALHHLALWAIVPASVFNYSAPMWVVAVHAAFVVLESVAACYIARSFFDNVIGLEKIVQARTAELDSRNQDMRLLLDNVGDAFVTLDASGRLSAERSRAFDIWFGPASATIFDAVEARNPAVATQLRLAWDALQENELPMDLLLDQLPKRLPVGATSYEISYVPIGASEPPSRVLVVITDVTAKLNRDRAEAERREVLHLFERLLADRGAVQSFFSEAGSLVESIVEGARGDMAMLKRRLHTLKGNSAVFGLDTVASLCHSFEAHIAEEGTAPASEELAKLSDRWDAISETVERLVGAGSKTIELSIEEHEALESEARRLCPPLWKHLRSLRLEPTKRRLEHFADQARRIAGRLDKEIDVTIVDNGLRVDPSAWGPFWSALIHAARNALDHGLEQPEERLAVGKGRAGKLTLTTRVTDSSFFVEVEDDGRGIDWDVIRQKAETEDGTIESLKAALFRDGVSTAREVTELSGRGIGMGALLEATRALGGEITIDSERGTGTAVRMSFPLAMMAPGPAPATLPPMFQRISEPFLMVAGSP